MKSRNCILYCFVGGLLLIYPGFFFAVPVQAQTVITHADFAAMVQPGATVFLPAGAIVQLKTHVYLPSGVTITTSATNPATIIKSDKHGTAFNVQGANIRIENVIMDFAMLGTWNDFNSLIMFKYPSWKKLKPDAPIRDITIQNVTFIDSSPPVTRTTRDCWAIDLAHNSTESLKNIRILGCRQLAKRIQLTGNGQGVGGIENLQISFNYVEFGHANSIAVSTSTLGAKFSDFLISNNELRNCTGIGVFVGTDGGKGDQNNPLKNIVIVNNHIEIDANAGEYPHCVAVRATDTCEGLVISENTFHTVNIPSGKTRWVTIWGSADSPGTYKANNNIFIGPSQSVIQNMTKLK